MKPVPLLPALAIVVSLLLLACSGDDDDEAVTPEVSPTVPGTIITASTPQPTATLETAPEATATEELGPEAQARNLALREAPPGLLQFTADGPYVVPGDALGVFYLNIETQEIEGWFDLVGNTSPIAFSGEGRFTLFERREQVFRGGQTYTAGYYLGDRESRKVYHWEGDAEPVYRKRENGGHEIASRGDLVLFRLPAEDDQAWLSVVNMSTGDVESAFQAEAELALFSEDGARIAFAGWRDTGSALAVEVWVTELATGDEVFRSPIEFDRLDLEGTIELLSSEDGETFTFGANAVKERFSSVAARFSWDGDKLTEIGGPRVFLSSGGDYAAVAVPVASGGQATWHSLNAVDTEDGRPLFRVVGVDERFNQHPYNRWLADGSGVVINRPDGSFGLAYADGRLGEYHGVPSPTSPDVFAVSSGGGTTGTVGAVDADGDPIVVISFQGGVRDFVDPWGDSGEEIRLLIPHFGHGGEPVSATIVQPYVEVAPYEGGPLLQISDVAVAFGLLDLHDGPGSDNVIGRIPEPYRVAIEEVRQLCHGNGYSDPQECPRSESEAPYEFMALVLGTEFEPGTPVTSFWGRVTTADGRTGWLLLQANVQGA